MQHAPIKKIRLKLNLSQKDLADKLGHAGSSTICNYEQNIRFPSVLTAWKLIDICKQSGVVVTLEDIYPRQFFIGDQCKK